MNLKRLTAVGLVVAASCVPEGKQNDGRLGIEVSEVEESSPLALTFEEAAEEFNVPVDLLKSLSYVETRLEPAVGDVEFDGQAQPFGLFALRGDGLDRAATLAGVSVDAVMTDDEANIRAAAALLSAYADETNIDIALRPEPAVWRPALERWVAIEDQELRTVFSDSVLSNARRGMAIAMNDGTTLLIGRDLEAAVEGEQGVDRTSAGLGATGVVWRASPNFNSRNGASVDIIVIHTCEGGYSGCVATLRDGNSSNRVSAHYVVNEQGTEVSHLVDENNRAWHVAASYRSRLNDGMMTNHDGQSTNTFSVGIEHAGRAAQASFPQGQLDRSVRLVRDITANHNIPRDRYHIVAHGRLQPESRIDPGPNWPWTSYLAAINNGSTPPPVTPPPVTPPPTTPPPTTPPPSSTIITIDNLTAGRFRASANWDESDWAEGRIGANYRFRAPAETSDLAEFKVPVTTAGRYEVFTRVPGNGYNAAAPFFVYHRGGRATVTINMSNQGGRWVSLGTYDFAATDDWIVAASCWASGRGYLIADAIKLEAR